MNESCEAEAEDTERHGERTDLETLLLVRTTERHGGKCNEKEGHRERGFESDYRTIFLTDSRREKNG